MKIRFLAVSLIASIWAAAANAQELSFVPEGVFSVSMSQDSLSWDQTHNKQKDTVSNVQQELTALGIQHSAVQGALSYSKSQQTSGFAYGLSSYFNLGMSVRNISFERASTLESLDSSNLEATSYVEASKSRKVSGAGDTELFVNMRHFHTDYGILISGIYIMEPTGKVEYDQQSPLHLGTGLRRFGYQLTWDGFVSGGYWYLHSLAQIAFDMKGKAKDSNGVEQILKGGSANRMSTEILHQYGWLHYGTGFNFFVEPGHKLGDQKISDGQLGSRYWVTLGLGNLSRLEKGPVALPWNFSVQVSNSYSGTNMPMAPGLLAKLTAYF